MYAVIRPALRSSSRARTPARFIRGRRYPQPQRTHSFHSTRCLAQDSKNPNPTPTSDGNPAVNQNDADKKNNSEKAAAAEQVDGQGAAEDPEVLAQKLQRSKEMTRRYSSALRRSQRRNRAQDLPPLHIPNWYLEKRVRLREDAPAHIGSSKRHDYTICLKHSRSGQYGSISIPVSTYSAAFKAVRQLTKALWRRDLTAEHTRLLARDFARRVGREDDLEFVAALENGEEPRTGLWEEMESIATQAAEHEKDPLAAEAKAARMRENLLQDGRRISPLQMAEVRANIAACLSAVQPAINHSFPAAKTNLILHSPSNGQETILNSAVQSLAAELDADVVALEAQDLAQLAGDYLGEGPSSSPHSIRSLGYEAYKPIPRIYVQAEKESFDEDQESNSEQPAGSEPFQGLPALKVFFNLKPGQAFGQGQSSRGSRVGSLFSPADTASSYRPASQSDINLEDLKLSTLLEGLIDATELKRDRSPTVSPTNNARTSRTPTFSELENSAKEPKLFDYSFKSEGEELDFSSALPVDPTAGLTFTIHHKSLSGRPQTPSKPKIIHVRDIKQLWGTQYGSRIVQKLEEIVRTRRSSGESIMLLGTTSSVDLTPQMSRGGIEGLQSEGGDGFFRTIVVTPGNAEEDGQTDDNRAKFAQFFESRTSRAEKKKNSNINLRHIQDMLRSLDPAATTDIADMEHGVEGFRRFSSSLPSTYFWHVMTYDQVHRIALTALGLRQLDPNAEQVTWAHVTLAMGLLRASDEVKFAYAKFKAAESANIGQELFGQNIDDLRASMGAEAKRRGTEPFKHGSGSKRRADLQMIKEGANAHEKRLMGGIVNPDEIKTTFDSIHVPQETVEAVRTLTSLSLLRPDAFNYGVLATEKISGALLYGPPGTGKTLLAKAVAKESGCTVLEVSGSQIMDKYVGEGEKNVAAIFSLARKLSPCIVFLDEADAIFGTRDRSSERTSHRDILNQFLKEWDGLNNMSVFVMVATNRPFDMDDAVIRRLPRRLLVDLPLQDDRKKILNIHLKGEQLDESVDLDDLAKRTPLYSGSDLKNVAVFAALAAVREENEQAALAAAKAQSAAESLAKATETIPLDAEKSSAEASSEPTPSSAPTSPDAPAPPTPTSTSTPTPSDDKAQPIPQLQFGHTYTFPERRILHLRHFDKALQEVSASISENMSSLTAIKKFDEQYGDRKGRRKKSMYGFGVGTGEEHREKEGRVRP